MNILVAGAGRIGLPVVRHLAAAGHAVRVHDVRPEVRKAALQAGASWAEEPATADLVVTVLPGSPELRTLMLSPGGLLDQLDGTWVDLTSASPELGAELAAAAQERGVAYVEAPVGGGVPAAEAGQLTLYAAGDPDVLERVRPVLEVFAKKIHYTGRTGTGYLTKLLVNLLWFTQAIAVGEALLLGQSGGLDAAVLRDMLQDGPAASAFIADSVPRLLAGDYLATFGLDRIVEELESIEEFAVRRKSPAGLIGQVTAQYRAALDRFGPVDGELLVVSHLEDLAGRRLQLEPPREVER
ncbi:NAD(P)-dependent oxidoreductase [Kribbella sp. NPDC026611]|uniref:NAD(P)-dependent oxidoreductase n=1 Tax=Kribbella sp. NPDC026611 TaxID=3154911 RepID=UPI0033C367CC